MRLISGTFAIAILALCLGAPAQACDNGPWTVTYGAGGKTRLNADGTQTLVGAAATLRLLGRGSIRIEILNPSATGPNLLKRRIEQARALLEQQGVAPERIEVVPVPTRSGMLAGHWVGKDTRISVAVVQGCGE